MHVDLLKHLQYKIFIFLSMVLIGSHVFAQDVEPLRLEEAEQMALRNDPMIQGAQERKTAMEERAVAAYSWPDPKLKIGFMNFPTTDYNFDREPMTQKVIGLTQMFPPAGASSAKRDEMHSMTEAAEYDVDDKKLKTIRNVRESWLSVYLHFHSQQLVSASVDIFSQLKKITRLQYRSGRGKQQDVIQAQLEESLLKDKELTMQTNYEKATAMLKQRLNVEAFGQPLDMQFPELPVPSDPDLVGNRLHGHPWVKAGGKHVKAAENRVKFANTQFRPGWSLDITNGQRGGNRDDFLSVMMMVDLPLFRGKRQSRELAASQSILSAAKHSLDDRRRVIRRRYEQSYATFNRTSERLNLFETQLLPQATQNTKAALSAYQSGVTTFTMLVRARLKELTSQLQHLKLKVNRANSQVELIYLAGGQ